MAPEPAHRLRLSLPTHRVDRAGSRRSRPARRSVAPPRRSRRRAGREDHSGPARSVGPTTRQSASGAALAHAGYQRFELRTVPVGGHLIADLRSSRRREQEEAQRVPSLGFGDPLRARSTASGSTDPRAVDAEGVDDHAGLVTSSTVSPENLRFDPRRDQSRPWLRPAFAIRRGRIVGAPVSFETGAGHLRGVRVDEAAVASLHVDSEARPSRSATGMQGPSAHRLERRPSPG